MKVLTIKEPWASLIVNGYKKYEFRSWKTKYRGEFLVHASINPDRKALEYFEDLNLNYQPGKIIGKVNLIACLEVTPEFEEKIIKENPQVYSLTKGRIGYAFKLDNIEKFSEPIEIKGKLGFWNYDENQK